MQIMTYDDLFLHQLEDIYDAENQILKALPEMAKAADDKDLKKAFEKHLLQTEEQIKRLDEIFDLLGEKSKRIECKGMKGLLEEGKECLKIDSDMPGVKDAALIGAARKVEHYEIAGYSSLILLAQTVELDEAEELLSKNLKEEQQTDELLSKQELIVS